MSTRRGLGNLEGPELLAHLAGYFPSLQGQAAAALLGAMTDDPDTYGEQLEQFVELRSTGTRSVR